MVQMQQLVLTELTLLVEAVEAVQDQVEWVRFSLVVRQPGRVLQQ